MKKFSNPRNAASGTLRLLDSEIIKSRGLDFYAYSSNINYFNNLKNHSLNLDWLTTQGFKISNPLKIISNIDEFREFSQKLEKNRNNFPFEIDGIVIKVDNFDFIQELVLLQEILNGQHLINFQLLKKKPN